MPNVKTGTKSRKDRSWYPGREVDVIAEPAIIRRWLQNCGRDLSGIFRGQRRAADRGMAVDQRARSGTCTSSAGSAG